MRSVLTTVLIMHSNLGALAIYDGPRASARLGGFGRLAPRAPRGLGQPCGLVQSILLTSLQHVFCGPFPACLHSAVALSIVPAWRAGCNQRPSAHSHKLPTQHHHRLSCPLLQLISTEPLKVLLCQWPESSVEPPLIFVLGLRSLVLQNLTAALLLCSMYYIESAIRQSVYFPPRADSPLFERLNFARRSLAGSHSAHGCS